MRPAFDADVIIAGAGLSGLSLAVALLDAGLPEDARVVLVDPRETLSGADRTWCFFDLVPHAFESAITHRWSRWRVRNGAAEVLRSAPGISYCTIPGERFYELALERLAAAGQRIELVLGVTVEHLEDRGAHVDVHTSAGVLRARLAMDSRPPSLTRAADDGNDVNLLQHFRGRVVRSTEPVFEADTATLMDFDVSQADGIHFIYVLPFDAHTALVESTFFTERPLPDAVYEAAIDTWLARRRPGVVFQTISHESGVIPMTTEPFDAWPSPRIVRIGTAGGHVKPSSGYAFLAVQRFVREFAPRVVSALRVDGCAEPPAARSRRTIALDTIFLSYLRSRPERAPDTFYRLFERVPPAVLARFLSDTGTLADDLTVMRTSDSPRLALEAIRATPLLRRKTR
ncbi:MAG: lycopene cyclase family protein [Mycobacteriaceae bacterium]|jgi:lycopene beta-cyclase